MDAREDGQSVEALLTGRGGLPVAVFAEVLARGGITLNRRRVTEARQLVHPRDELVAHVLARGAPPKGPAPIDSARILHLDEQLIAVDKPPGIPAQGTEEDANAGLDAAVRAYLAAQGVRTPFVGLVHRLDLETTGVTLFGRTAAAVTELTRQFREGEIRKTYIAVLSGVPSWTEKQIDAPIGADPRRQGAWCISPRGRPAVSDFRLLEAHEGWCKVEVHPRTGRTHQIRVHAASMGHPLLGDRRYGGPEALTTVSGERIEVPRVALHAAGLSCRHPAGALLSLVAPWPADLAAFEEQANRPPKGVPGAFRP